MLTKQRMSYIYFGILYSCYGACECDALIPVLSRITKREH